MFFRDILILRLVQKQYFAAFKFHVWAKKEKVYLVAFEFHEFEVSAAKRKISFKYAAIDQVQ